MQQDKTDALSFGDDIDPNYKKGFEHGYWLQRGGGKHLDDLMKQSKTHTTYYSGLKGGSKEALREQFKDRMKDKGNDNQKDKDHGMELS